VELLERDDHIAPALFQKKITGTNVRVHVVGQNTFACGIQSDVLDYRYGPRVIHELKLPPDIHDKCIVLTEHLGLLVAGIDFIVTSHNEWYCLEANPNPGFSFYDISKEKVIARAVADLLLSRKIYQ
jgi:glutathione synthase/RimK-type ligase-like ATP-grasp enzyme